MPAPQFSIAMATYNGARYLKEQLDSITGQTLLPLELVVGDDGSTDATLELLHAFAETAPFPVRIHRNPENLGFADNFLSTAARCAGDWIAFCDQDDRWYPDKLASVAEAVRQNSAAFLVVHRLDYARGDGTLTGSALPHRMSRRSSHAFGQRASWTHGGCAMAFDARLVREIHWRSRPSETFDWTRLGQSKGRLWPHDRWISLLGNMTGPIATIDRSLGLFRRHDHTVSGSHIVTLTDQIAAMAGAEDYARAAASAAEVASILERVSGGSFDRALRNGARKFEKVADNERGRQALYESRSVVRRMARWVRLLAAGAYVGDRFCSAGFRPALKDLAVAVAGESIIRKSQGMADKARSGR